MSRLQTLESVPKANSHLRKAYATIQPVSRQCTVIRVEVPNKSSWEGWILLRSDAHHDNAKCNRTLEKQHLDEAIARNALIMDCGDLFCAMQGKFDPRSSRSAITPEQQGRNDYLNVLIDEATQFYTPYKQNWATMSHGNHETGILNRCGVDLTAFLAERLEVPAMSYGGFIRLQFSRQGAGWKESKIIAYHHGHGVGGPVTRGVIGTARRAAIWPDADVVWSGHTHESWTVVVPQQKLNAQNRITRRDTLHISTPGYKDEHSSMEGWAVEKGLNPKPLGAAWLRLIIRNDKIRIEAQQALA